MFKEFREFALRGNVVDMAVGIIIGAAFGTIVRSLVDDVVMPPIGLLVGDVDFQDLFVVLREGAAGGPYDTLAAAREAGAVVLAWGVLINAIVSFAIVAAVLFLLVRWINRARASVERGETTAAETPTTRACPFCVQQIPLAARRCAFCTSEVESQPA